MATLKKSFYISVIFTAIMALTSHASASEVESSAAKALEVAENIESSKLVITVDDKQFNENLVSLDNEEKLHYIRVNTTDALALRNTLDSKILINDYMQLATKLNDKRNIILSNLYTLYDSYRDSSGKFENFDEFKANLRPYIDNTDWVISHRANLFLSVQELPACHNYDSLKRLTIKATTKPPLTS